MGVKHRGFDVRYGKLKRQRADGLCSKDDKEIVIDERLSARRKLVVLVHEHLHRMHWDWSEKQVVKESEDLASAIWKMGYRLVELK